MTPSMRCEKSGHLNGIKTMFKNDIELDSFYDDFDHVGWKHFLLLDPEGNNVYVWTGFGPGTPANVWHRRAIAYSLPPCRGKELAAWVDNHCETIQALLDTYEGPTWDGNNNVGSWSEDREEYEGDFRLALEQIDLPYRWLACDYFADDYDWAVKQLKSAIDVGRTVEQWAKEAVEESEENDAPLAVEDVVKWANNALEEQAEA